MKPIPSLTDAEFEQLACRAARLPEAPAAWVNAAVALFPRDAAAPGAAPGAAGWLQRTLAVLSFDSWAAGALAAGVRALPGDARHLVFSAEGRDIDLRIVPAGAAYLLSGQILGPDETGSVRLVGEGAGTGQAHTAALNALGEFHFNAMPAGRYLMTLQLASNEVRLPAVEVGAQRP